MKTPLKILVLEDNSTDAELIKRLLKSDNPTHTFFVVASREEYYDALNTFKPDVILSDKSLSQQFDGMEALKIVQDQSPDIPFIMVSGTVSEEYSAEIIKLGADDFLLKDRLSRLPAAIYASLRQRQTEKEKRRAEEDNRIRAKLLNTIAQAVMATDSDGILNFWNHAAHTIYGWTEQEALGKNIFQLLQMQRENEKEHHIMDGLKRGNSWEGELMATSKNGNMFPVFFTAAPFYDKGNIFSGTIAVSADITERKKTEVELKELNNELRRLSGHLELVREEERLHVAKKIHDELAQQLTGLKIEASLLFKTLDIKDEVIQQKADDIINLIDHTLKSGLRILSNLRPAILDDLGLVAALEWYSEEVQMVSGIKVDFISAAKDLKLDEIKSITLFRIYQEVLLNITGIAGASTIKSNLTLHRGCIVLQVKNDGKRMVTTTVKNEKALDIIEIEERVYLLGGQFEMKMEPGGCTEIKIIIPL